MATPKFDRISVELARRIGDRDSSGNQISAASADGVILTSVERTSYINKAMMKLMNQFWQTVNGDTQKFMGVFPELVKEKSIVVAGGSYSLEQSGTYDFFKLVGAITSSLVYIKIWKENLYTVALSGANSHYVATTTEPAVIQLNQSLKFFPTSFGDTVTVIYVKMPVSDIDGSFIVQGGNVDSPFFDFWNSQIAEIAETLYLTDAQEKL